MSVTRQRMSSKHTVDVDITGTVPNQTIGSFEEVIHANTKPNSMDDLVQGQPIRKSS